MSRGWQLPWRQELRGSRAVTGRSRARQAGPRVSNRESATLVMSVASGAISRCRLGAAGRVSRACIGQFSPEVILMHAFLFLLTSGRAVCASWPGFAANRRCPAVILLSELAGAIVSFLRRELVNKSSLMRHASRRLDNRIL